MLHIVPIPVLCIAIILYYGCGVGGLKTFQKIAKLLIIASIAFFILAYATYLGYEIPVISNILRNINI